MLRELNQTERKAGRLPAGWEYGLPTEAQSGYACRAGSQTAYSFGDDDAELPRHGNSADRSLLESRVNFYHDADARFDDGWAFLAPVGSYRANAWGLCDIHGNVAEMCATRYG